VVPIDAEVARAIARRAVKFRWFVGGLAALWLGILIPVLIFTPLPPLVPFVVLGALLVLAEHRFVLFGDETSMSGSIIVAIASVFVFAETAPLAGPMLVASLGGLYLPHIRDREYSKFVTNASAMSLAAVGAAIASKLAPLNSSPDVTTLAASIVFACLSYWAINNAVVCGYIWSREGIAIRQSFAVLVTSDACVLIYCGFASALVVASDSHPAISYAAVAAFVGLNSLTTTRYSPLKRTTRFWARNSYTCQLACWSAAAAALSGAGVPLVRIGLLVGSGIAFAFWSRKPASAAYTIGTVAITLVAVSWLDPLAAFALGLVGIAIVHLVSLRPAGLRSSCVVGSALVLSGLITQWWIAGAVDALLVVATLIAAIALPRLLAAVYVRACERSTSIMTCAGMIIPSTVEALVALGGCLVLAAISFDALAGIFASALLLLPITWLSDHRQIRSRETAVDASG
jgi:hypothetical protein